MKNMPTKNELAKLFPDGEICLDAIAASKHFSGLNQIEAFSLLEENCAHYLECLRLWELKLFNTMLSLF